MSEQETPPSHPDLSSFTVRAQRILAYAQTEAARFGQAYVSPEHLLLALLREEDTLAVRVLRNRGVVPQTLRSEIEQRIEQGTERSIEPLPFTPRSLHVIALSQEEARRMYNRYIGTEHLLLGLMRERDSLAGRLLARQGVDLEGLRRSFNSLQEHKDITDQISTQRQQREVDDLIAVLRKEGRKRQPSMSAWIAIFYWIGFLPIILLATAALLDEVFQGRIEWGIALTVILFIWMGVGLSRSTVSLRQKRAARQLAAYQDPRTVSYLVALLAWPDGKIQSDAMHALTKVLPQLRTNHANWLRSRQRRILYSKLSGPYILKEPDFVIAILKSLEQIGDAEALPYVQKLVTIEATLPDHKRVQEAANACLPFLQERVEQSQSRETLLRASSVAATPSEHLLRPAQEASTPPDQMLRPLEPERDSATVVNTGEEN